MAILAVLDGCEKDEGADTKLEDEKLRRLEERLRKRKARPPVYVAREQVRKAIKVAEKEEKGAESDTREQRLRLVQVSVLQKLKTVSVCVVVMMGIRF